MGVKVKKAYCSYFPALVKALEEVDGPVMEMGMGIFSTPFLHWMCLEQNRNLCSYDDNISYCMKLRDCQTDFHEIGCAFDWDDAPTDEKWGIVLVDHAPAERRRVDIERLADNAKCIIAHDSQPSSDKNYHYSEIYPLFKYKREYKKGKPETVVLSNFIDVTKW